MFVLIRLKMNSPTRLHIQCDRSQLQKYHVSEIWGESVPSLTIMFGRSILKCQKPAVTYQKRIYTRLSCRNIQIPQQQNVKWMFFGAQIIRSTHRIEILSRIIPILSVLLLLLVFSVDECEMHVLILHFIISNQSLSCVSRTNENGKKRTWCEATRKNYKQ